METLELVQIFAAGEDTGHQFKRNFTNAESLAAEMIAFTNGDGGDIFIGVEDNGIISGLNANDIGRLNQLISNTASQNVHPPINTKTQNIITDHGIVIVLHIPQGISRPYHDNNGTYWVKNGSDKRKITSREELQRLFQSTGLVHADETLVNNTSLSDIDMEYFSAFFEKRFDSPLSKQKIPLRQLIQNMNLGHDDRLNVTATLLFTKQPDSKLPVFIVKAGAFHSETLTTSDYSDSKDIKGKIVDVFYQTVDFILSNLHHQQNGQNVNSLGKSEIPRIVMEELVANALIHREYFISAPVRICVFMNRVEIISPGHLPNNLTIENIKAGNSNVRNPILASFANQIIPYRGFGGGIIRALGAYPNIDFVDDRDGNQFKAIIHRLF
ncbi:transcriptional regulator [Spirochaetia bacterium]|nr:transcriptional regulator [Spirochaetia bacterium]